MKRRSNGPAMLASFAAIYSMIRLIRPVYSLCDLPIEPQKVPVQVAHRKQDVWHSVLDRHEGLEPKIGWHSVGRQVDGLVADKGTCVSL